MFLYEVFLINETHLLAKTASYKRVNNDKQQDCHKNSIKGRLMIVGLGRLLGIQKCIQNPVKHLKLSLTLKAVNYFQMDYLR